MIVKVLLLATVFIGICFVGFALSILVKKNGKFPELHIGRNKELKKRGIACATSQDKMEQAKAKKSLQTKEFNLLDKELDSM